MTSTVRLPVGQDVHTAPCFWQKVQPQARAGISFGSGRQSSLNFMLPQWQVPRIRMVEQTMQFVTPIE